MTQPNLSAVRFENGIWEGHLSGQDKPDLRVCYLDQDVEGIEISELENGWLLRIPVPLAAVADGVHTVVIHDQGADVKLGDFTLIAGSVVEHDLRAEVELLRAELDMLKRAFRRHCRESDD